MCKVVIEQRRLLLFMLNIPLISGTWVWYLVRCEPPINVSNNDRAEMGFN
jgi:hypothetical protein